MTGVGKCWQLLLTGWVAVTTTWCQHRHVLTLVFFSCWRFAWRTIHSQKLNTCSRLSTVCGCHAHMCDLWCRYSIVSQISSKYMFHYIKCSDSCVHHVNRKMLVTMLKTILPSHPRAVESRQVVPLIEQNGLDSWTPLLCDPWRHKNGWLSTKPKVVHEGRLKWL